MSAIKVLTINILNDLTRREARRTLLAQGLAELQADLIGLQEVTCPLAHSAAHWLADRLGGYSVYICPQTGEGREKMGNIALMRQRFVSAHAVCHGCEPEYTCPTPLTRPGTRLRRIALYLLNLITRRQFKPWRGTLDYIFVNDRLRVSACNVVLNRPAPHDPTLYPSDHFGLAARLEIP